MYFQKHFGTGIVVTIDCFEVFMISDSYYSTRLDKTFGKVYVSPISKPTLPFLPAPSFKKICHIPSALAILPPAFISTTPPQIHIANPTPIHIHHSIHISHSLSISTIPPTSPPFILFISKSTHIITDTGGRSTSLKFPTLVWNHRLPLKALPHVKFLGTPKYPGLSLQMFVFMTMLDWEYFPAYWYVHLVDT